MIFYGKRFGLIRQTNHVGDKLYLIILSKIIIINFNVYKFFLSSNCYKKSRKFFFNFFILKKFINNI